VPRRQKGQDTLGYSDTVLDFLFPFSARKTIAVRRLPADRPHSKNETSSDNHCWPKFLPIDLVSVAADLRAFVSGSHAMSPVSGQFCLHNITVDIRRFRSLSQAEPSQQQYGPFRANPR